MTLASKALGNWGEQVACDYLAAQGYKTLDRNFRNKLGELDLVFQDTKGVVVFVEVKTRQSLGYGAPHEAVHYHKIRKIGQLAQSYLKYKFQTHDILSRFDVISIYREDAQSAPAIEHIKNAFDLSPRLI